MSAAKVWAISTNKGGVLKTSMTTNLAGVFALKGYKVLIIDSDNQGNVSLSFGKNPDGLQYTLYDVLVDGLDANYPIFEAVKNIDILPSNDDMAFFEFDVLTNQKDFKKPFELMADRLEQLKGKYDYILVDTPPNLGLTQGNVMSFVDKVLIPFQPENYSMRSLVKMLKSIKQFRDAYNPSLDLLGVVGTLVDGRTSLHSQVLAEGRKYCYEHQIPMFDTVIPRSIQFASSVAYERLPAVLTNKKHPIVESYYQLYDEIKDF